MLFFVYSFFFVAHQLPACGSVLTAPGADQPGPPDQGPVGLVLAQVFADELVTQIVLIKSDQDA